MDFSATAREAECAGAEGRIRTARDLLERLIEAFPRHGILLHYNLGCVYRSMVGSGTKARECYQRALRAPSPVPTDPNNEMVNTVRANCIENLMLLSLSFDEFHDWERRLAEIQPDNDILKKHSVAVRENEERGRAWAEEMMVQASSYFSADPQKDAGLYAEAASTFELLLSNRQRLRVPRATYRIALISYSALVMKACAKHGAAMEISHGGKHDPRELLFIMEEARPFIQAYVDEYPDDSRARECLEATAQCIRSMRASGAQGSGFTVTGSTGSAPSGSQTAVAPAEHSTTRFPAPRPILKVTVQWLILAIVFLLIFVFGLARSCRP